ncbi:hypothetical protein GCM10017714_31890 [Curtobacterium pusillum]|uniref:ESX-1 secretion-associated protein n=1 Tax=Curtobacterium pusillum TaxID=69373 RepID=A0ABX2MD31_9MICO|nr:hypothetical protein [Curtobacterium pusillum]NUU14678.1 hypothetical protein [Curtobacterium pusillum]GLK31777.1 hypothetical protein GCM10017610_20620 [Curtobacterium pusillum]
MSRGWKVDIAGSKAIIDKTANAGSCMQDASVDVDAALRAVVSALTGTDAAGSAQGFLNARQGDATAAVRAVQRAITAATGAMSAFAEADATMASHTAVASADAGGRGKR